MKGRFKDRAKQITLIVLFLIISTLGISLISGRINTEEILIVKKDGLNTDLPLDQQLEFFEKKEILKSEMKYFKGSVVTDINQLKGKISIYDLKVGSPIPFSSLMEPKGAGQFASVMPEGRTVHLLSQAVLGLPPIQEGDEINIALVYKQKLDEGAEALRVGLLMTNVKVYKVGEADIYVDVSIEESLILHTASQLGTFIYQVPGQKVELDDDVLGEPEEENSPSVIEQSDIFNAILNKTYSNTEKDKDNEENKNIDKNETAEEISKSIVNPSDESENTDEEDESNGSDNNAGGENDEQ